MRKLWKDPATWKLFLVGTALAILFRGFLVEDFRVASASMEPLLRSGDLVFVFKSAFNLKLPFTQYELLRFRNPKLGQVVLFTIPGRRETYLKRIVGLEGDVLEIRKGQFLRNGKVIPWKAVEPGDTKGRVTLLSERLSDSIEYPVLWNAWLAFDYGPVEVPKDHFFVMGDNRVISVDSRTWGPLPYSCLQGEIVLRWQGHQGSKEAKHS